MPGSPAAVGPDAAIAHADAGEGSATSRPGERSVESRVRENLTHGSGRGRRKRGRTGATGTYAWGTGPKGRKPSRRMPPYRPRVGYRAGGLLHRTRCVTYKSRTHPRGG